MGLQFDRSSRTAGGLFSDGEYVSRLDGGDAGREVQQRTSSRTRTQGTQDGGEIQGTSRQDLVL